MVSQNLSVASSGGSTVTKSTRKEVNALKIVCISERNTKSVTICVSRREAVSNLKEVCRYKPGIFTFEVNGLQGKIDNAKPSSRYTILNILISREIAELPPFHVPGSFKELRILRCAKANDTGTLMLDGTSTYSQIRLDEWQEMTRPGHKLIIGYERGVRIKLSNVSSLRPWSRSRANLSDQDKGTLRRYFSALASLMPGSTTGPPVAGSTPTSTSLRQKIKSTIAGIMGILVCGSEFSATLNGGTSLGGMTFKYSFGIHCAEMGLAAGGKTAAVATAAGSALVLGVATATAIYYIPWSDLFEWLGIALTSIWDVVGSLWQRFKDMVMWVYSTCLGGKGDGEQQQ
ncbi:hypothetical protein SEUCBS140593_009239 [Sporothrix eucalyptigena]|uniref:Uncharacterized protein n=1 Tax=Sporothrix eucalyptigena TaxID=1812306 RepID=A0ABP0CTQ9_9PEZI